MALKIPTLQEITDQNIINFEAALNQKIPLTDQAFVRVVAFIQAASATGLYKYTTERALQNLALTATGEDLDKLGNNYGVVRKVAIAAVLDISLPAIDDTIISVTNAFIGDANGVRYLPNAQVVASGGTADLTVTAEETGVVGNLNVSDTLTIESLVAGAESIATVTAIDTLGTERETDDAYRERILDEIRTVGGGGNGVDYRTWAERTPGVRRAFPYAGRPPAEGTSLPGERVVYIEAESSIDPDGIAPQSLLDSAREYIDRDPITEQTQTPLGLPNIDGETLWVESITRTGMYIEVRNLIVDPDLESQLKDDLEAEFDNYFRTIVPFVDGVDVEVERNDAISSITVGTVAQSIFVTYGATAASVGFGTTIGVFLTYYVLGQGEMSKLQQVSYLTL
jgi:hypothetical protein